MQQQTARCRGLRKWCGRRCDATAPLPEGYPLIGFYCTLHKYQEPKAGTSSVFESPEVEEHIRRRTSFVAPEASVASDMLKAMSVVKDRPEYGKTAAGADIVTWLKGKRGLDEEGALSYAQRMVDLRMLEPVRKEFRRFSTEPNALYWVQAKPADSTGPGR